MLARPTRADRAGAALLRATKAPSQRPRDRVPSSQRAVPPPNIPYTPCETTTGAETTGHSEVHCLGRFSYPAFPHLSPAKCLLHPKAHGMHLTPQPIPPRTAVSKPTPAHAELHSVSLARLRVPEQGLQPTDGAAARRGRALRSEASLCIQAGRQRHSGFRPQQTVAVQPRLRPAALGLENSGVSVPMWPQDKVRPTADVLISRIRASPPWEKPHARHSHTRPGEKHSSFTLVLLHFTGQEGFSSIETGCSRKKLISGGSRRQELVLA